MLPEDFTAEEISKAFEGATEDSWGVPSHYESTLLSKLRSNRPYKVLGWQVDTESYHPVVAYHEKGEAEAAVFELRRGDPETHYYATDPDGFPLPGQYVS